MNPLGKSHRSVGSEGHGRQSHQPCLNASGLGIGSGEEETEDVVERTRGIVSLLEVVGGNVNDVCEKFAQLGLNEHKGQISSVVEILVEEAISKPSLSGTIAQIVWNVSQSHQEIGKVFRFEILNKIQKEFQKTNTDENEMISKKQREVREAPDDKKEMLKSELEDLRTRLRRRALGTVGFIGEVFKLHLLTPKIMVDCIQILLGNQDEESYECVCKLLSTGGQKLEQALKDAESQVRDAKARGDRPPKFAPDENYMDKTFKKLKNLSADTKLSSRIRLALNDLVKLRDSIWVPRWDSKAPKTIGHVRRDAIRKEQEEKRLIQALPDVNPTHMDGQRRSSPMNQNQSTQPKKGGWNTVSSAKSSRFSQVTKSTDASNCPVLGFSAPRWGEPPPFNRPSSNNSILPPRLRLVQQLNQQQQQQNRNRFFTSSASDRFSSLSTESASSSPSAGINLMPGGGSVSTGGPPPSHLIQSSQQHH